jgi:hypothetical protein
VDASLYIDFGSQVKNRFGLDQAGIRTLNITDFHQTFTYALSHSLTKSFKTVKPYTGKESGFVLRVNQVRSQWLIGREKRILSAVLRDTVRVQDFACFIRYSSTLYYNGKPLRDIEGEIRQKPDYSRSWRIENLFQQTLKLSCEDIARKVLGNS